jgi:hypothetical protein
MVRDEGSTAEHPLFKAVTCSSANYGVASRAYGLEESPCIDCPEGMVTAHLFKSNITGQQRAVPADHQVACTAAQMLKQGAGCPIDWGICANMLPCLIWRQTGLFYVSPYGTSQPYRLSYCVGD